MKRLNIEISDEQAETLKKLNHGRKTDLYRKFTEVICSFIEISPHSANSWDVYDMITTMQGHLS